MDNKAVGKRVIDAVGGKENINSLVHCATRLRFNLKNEEVADTKKLNQDPDVIQVVQSGGQYQVVIGSNVADVYNAIMEDQGMMAGDDNAAPSGNILNRFIDIISSIFTPFLGAMAGAGVLKGFLTLATVMNWMSATSGTYTILYTAADGLFNFLPVLLAFTAAKKFKTNEYLAVLVAFALVYPSISTAASAGTSLDFFGIPVILSASGYTSSVIPILLAIYVQSKFEPLVKKVVPQALQLIFVPLIVLLVMVPVTFIVLGPIGTVIGNALGSVFGTVYGFSPIVAGLIMGGLWQVFVMFGMHWGFVPIMMLNIADMGYDYLAPMLLAAVIAQAGASLAVAFKAKDTKLKSLGFSAALTAVFGITEPTVYGVTLPLKKPFIAACVGGGIGGAIIGFGQVKTFAFGLISLLSIPSFFSTDPNIESNVTIAVVGTVVAFAIAFIGTFVLGFNEGKEDEAVEEAVTAGDQSFAGRKNLQSPLTGKIMPLSEVKDPVFSSGAMGKGVAIEPTVGELRAPADGEISTIFPTGHAVGMTTDDGVEILMHIGMDTVELKGEGFEAQVKQGDHVSAGDLLVKFNLDTIKEAGYSTITPIVITNTNDYSDVLDLEQTDIVASEDFLAIVK